MKKDNKSFKLNLNQIICDLKAESPAKKSIDEFEKRFDVISDTKVQELTSVSSEDFFSFNFLKPFSISKETAKVFLSIWFCLPDTIVAPSQDGGLVILLLLLDSDERVIQEIPFNQLKPKHIEDMYKYHFMQMVNWILEVGIEEFNVQKKRKQKIFSDFELVRCARCQKMAISEYSTDEISNILEIDKASVEIYLDVMKEKNNPFPFYEVIGKLRKREEDLISEISKYNDVLLIEVAKMILKMKSNNELKSIGKRIYNLWITRDYSSKMLRKN
jgi:hypothetical protein